MFKLLRKRNGQGLAVQYATVFFLVLAAIFAMSVYVRRALQARIHDARFYMANIVNGLYSDPNLNIAGNYIMAYAPYYAEAYANRDMNLYEIRRELGAPGMASGISVLTLNDVTHVETYSNQAPPRDAY